MQFSFLTQPGQKDLNQSGPRKSKNDFSDHSKMTDADWEHRFEQLLDLHLINVPHDFYEDQLFFKKPEELKGMFAKTEEENL